MSASAPKRQERVAERIKVELMELFLRGVVRDPAAGDAYVSAVEVSDDLRHARIYVRLLRTEVDEPARRRTVEALERASGFLRRELAPKLKMKYHPELRFYWDEGLDRAARVEQLLSEIDRTREDQRG